ncbi:hypothetical protein THAOC_14821 [Thalassiosira oceanica]|uniref:Uncharacterized protein n=1 Tax=Thalassiosira oceanica TaxID=159749 RepID=K0T1T0_THAOC|nr:hypothetical protein THAOC_14821 [Thalassiosira oceanica]|eukprot:EJK64442.1 hypothetical protein THAOC_14821 [Thalassiosira oceanica]
MRHARRSHRPLRFLPIPLVVGASLPVPLRSRASRAARRRTSLSLPSNPLMIAEQLAKMFVRAFVRPHQKRLRSERFCAILTTLGISCGGEVLQ